ncbi:hypothetical protein M885DRAFT_526171 [Pelagophyceae sp. CCMP2097]|nr:hypothetical protein M885DRAFT_526171 [Pelagophyceae sp. CCMP2097]
MGLRFVLLWAATAAVAGVLDFIGRDVGITSQTMLTEDQAARVLEDAREGHADSLHFSALLHLYGKGGVKQNSYKALDIFKAAAAKGHAASQVALGVMLRHGHGTTRDDKAAFAWFAAAARQGHVEGMWLLGVMHVEGLGTTAPDYGEARKWLRLSAQTAKSPDAMHWLGVMEEYGLGSVEANLTAAVEWYTKSHRAGHVTSAFHLGLMHAYGRGVNQDHARGMLLFQDAVAKGHAGAMYYLGVMALCVHPAVGLRC